MLLSVKLMFLVSYSFSIIAEFNQFIFIFSALSVIVFVETFKLH
jgi:hypothetical protein